MTIQTKFPATKPRTRDFQDVASCGDYSLPITSDAHRRQVHEASSMRNTEGDGG